MPPFVVLKAASPPVLLVAILTLMPWSVKSWAAILGHTTHL